MYIAEEFPLRSGAIHVDLFKCHAWPDVVEEAQRLRPSYVHFPLAVGSGSGDALDKEAVVMEQYMPAGYEDVTDISGSGPPEQRLAVLGVLHEYLNVTDDHDYTAIGRSFHPTAMLMSVTASGSLAALTQDVWWERVSRIPADTPRRQARIFLVSVTDRSGVAGITITNAHGSVSTDYFTLLEGKDGWRIVNKVLSQPL